MSVANINVKIDANVFELATRLLNGMGIDQSTAIDLFYRQIIFEKRLPFQPVANHSLDEQILAAIAAKNIPTIKLESDGKGNIMIDKEQNLEDYDWAVNG